MSSNTKDAFSNVIGGKLKLKNGRTAAKTATKKRKEAEKETTEVQVEVLTGSTGKGKTEAELRFEEVERQKQEEILAKRAKKTHRERIADYNEQLKKLTEHNDLPRIGPG